MDVETIFALIDKAEASSFDSIEIQTQDLKLSLVRQSHSGEAGGDTKTPEIQTFVQPVSPEASPLPENLVTAPISGVFYRCKDPQSPPFVEAGDHVNKGQTLCIIEAMKTMNEITSPKSGIIESVYPGNNEPITVGEALFAFAKEG